MYYILILLTFIIFINFIFYFKLNHLFKKNNRNYALFINKFTTIINKFMSDVHDATYYLKCMMGGILACGLTHTAIVPLDVMKCKKQLDPTFSTGMLDGVKKVSANNQMTLGWSPTLLGYSLQGLGKFGFY